MAIKSSNPLAPWIREAIMLDEDGPCKMIACVHKDGNQEVEVDTVRFTADKGYTAENLAERFYHRATSHVAEIPGSQLFALYAFYGENKEPSMRRTFRVNNTDVESGFGMTDPPTPQGQIQQSMRHGEAALQTALKHTQYMLDKQFQMINMVMNQNQQLMKNYAEVTEAASATILARAENQAQVMLEQAKKDAWMELLKMAPPLVNRLTGVEVFPQATADSKLLEALLDKLDTPTLEKLSGILSPQALGLIAARANQYHEEKNRAVKAAEKALTNGSTHTDTPEAEGDFH